MRFFRVLVLIIGIFYCEYILLIQIILVCNFELLMLKSYMIYVIVVFQYLQRLLQFC
jgi:hypothetical protein